MQSYTHMSGWGKRKRWGLRERERERKQESESHSVSWFTSQMPLIKFRCARSISGAWNSIWVSQVSAWYFSGCVSRKQSWKTLLRSCDSEYSKIWDVAPDHWLNPLYYNTYSNIVLFITITSMHGVCCSPCFNTAFKFVCLESDKKCLETCQWLLYQEVEI